MSESSQSTTNQSPIDRLVDLASPGAEGGQSVNPISISQRILTLAGEGVDAQVASLQVTGNVNHGVVGMIERLVDQEGVDNAQTICKLAAQEMASPAVLDRMDQAMDEYKQVMATSYEQMRQGQRMTQFLGVALRGILPFAMDGVAERRYAAQLVPSDQTVQAIASDAQLKLRRAEAALAVLQESSQNIESLGDSDYDDDFQIYFEE